MRRENELILIVTDVVGAGVLAGCLVTSVWFLFVQSNETTREMAALRSRAANVRRDLTSVRQLAEQKSSERTATRRELDATGQLPTRTPVDRYSQTVLDLAARFELRVIRQNPVAPRTYPGLLEQRYAYEMHGATRDFVAFFAAVEQTNFWADISYLRFTDGGTSGPNSSDDRVASFTVSLFSALEVEKEKQDGTG
ncbi:MAG: hypothetical protein IIC51_00175 [Planctomycetes bacterium]|nr:hypothetical protein [Planctomycetota bacterium]